jgi:hypothetical protein
MPRSLLAYLPPLGLLLTPLLAGAGTVDRAVFALHAQSHAQKAAYVCGSANPDNAVPPLACRDYRVAWPVKSGADVYLVIAEVDTGGVSGATFGIDYPASNQTSGISVFGWTLCTTGLEFPGDGWPQPATGNIVTWLTPNQCAQQFIGQDGIHAVAGAFYVYAYGDGVFSVREHPQVQSSQRLVVTNCNGVATVFQPGDTWRLGKIGFGSAGTQGFTPCSMVPVRPTTWGRLKSHYGN